MVTHDQLQQVVMWLAVYVCLFAAFGVFIGIITYRAFNRVMAFVLELPLFASIRLRAYERFAEKFEARVKVNRDREAAIQQRIRSTAPDGFPANSGSNT